MSEVATTAMNTAEQYGPFFALSVGLISATLVFLAILLKNFLHRGSNSRCSNSEIRVAIDSLRKNQEKLFDKIDKISENVSKMQSELSFLYGQQNRRKP